MPFNPGSATTKRLALRAGLASGEPQRFIGAMSPLVAMECKRLGFEGIYVSGATLAADLGLPDIGLTTMSEVLGRSHQIARVTDLPTLVDIDTGFGSLPALARTIRGLEDLGLTGCHLEDQIDPKRCGHLDGKRLVSREDMVRRVETAVAARRDPSFVIVARTDAYALEGLDGTIDRAAACIDAGADVIFPEALPDQATMAAVRSALNVPLLLNATEFGKSELLTHDQIQALGYELVIYPVTALRLAMKAISDGLVLLRDQGTQAGLLERMQTRQELQALLRYGDYQEIE